MSLATQFILNAPPHLRVGESTRAWILRRSADGEPRQRGELELATIGLPPLGDDQILVETLYGSWEGNMTHALLREPIDVCRRLGQDWIVLGNGGVVRVLARGRDGVGPREGAVCLFAGLGKRDRHGYVRTVSAFDEPGTMGVLAERFYVNAVQLVPLPDETIAAPIRWPSFSARYAPAWSNWRVALGAWRLQMPQVPPERIHVWGWGGGVAFAELQLARALGCKTVMLHSGTERADLIRAVGITPLDRREFPGLSSAASPADRRARLESLRAERSFLNAVDRITEGDRVSIFIDNIGGPALSPTLRALSRQGVITSCGWKHGHMIEYHRAVECIERHIFVHTHAYPVEEGLAAMRYAIETGWLPPLPQYVYRWEEIPKMAEDYAAGRITSYFPTFATPAADSLSTSSGLSSSYDNS
jgi:NADPH:quinone reductase-like Zn-dependent oxidoreductase